MNIEANLGDTGRGGISAHIPLPATGLNFRHGVGWKCRSSFQVICFVGEAFYPASVVTSVLNRSRLRTVIFYGVFFFDLVVTPCDMTHLH